MLKKNLGQFSKNYCKELLTHKIVTKLSKIWVWDPGSGIPDPGVKKAPDPRSATLVKVHNAYGSYKAYLKRL